MLLLAEGRFKHEVLEAFSQVGYGNVGVAVVALRRPSLPKEVWNPGDSL